MSVDLKKKTKQNMIDILMHVSPVGFYIFGPPPPPPPPPTFIIIINYYWGEMDVTNYSDAQTTMRNNITQLALCSLHLNFCKRIYNLESCTVLFFLYVYLRFRYKHPLCWLYTYCTRAGKCIL